MNAPLLSPTALALINKPAGITATQITDRTQWLALRKSDVTASVAAALWGDGVHDYESPYGLWALKSGIIEEREIPKKLARRGNLLEPVALQILAEDYPDWRVEKCQHYYSDPASGLGGTPDAIAIRPDMPGFGGVQVKTAGQFAFKKKWVDSDGDIEIPMWIVIQASLEAALTGASWAVVIVLTGDDLDLHVIEIPLKPALMVKMRELAADFWRRVNENDPYPPDYGRDADVLEQIYSTPDDVEIDLTSNNRIAELIEQREGFKVTEAAGSIATEKRKLIDIEIKAILGDATRGRLADGRVVSAPVTKRGSYVVKETSYRTVKIGFPKLKKVAAE